MNSLKTIVNSFAFILVSALLGAGLCAALIIPVSSHIADVSVSVSDNFVLVGLFMALCVLSSFAQMRLLVRLIWGKSGVATTAEEGDLAASMRAMRVTGTKISLIFLAVLTVNIFVFDALGRGTLVTASARWGVLTRLRSGDAQTRADAMPRAIRLIGDEDVAHALRRVIRQKGPAREWAAWAAGIRRDAVSRDALQDLMRSGTPRERAAAAMALARLLDPDLVQLALEVWPQMGDYRADLLIALGTVGKQRRENKDTIFSNGDLKLAGDFLVARLTGDELKGDKVLTRLAIWGLNRFESPEGLPWLENLLSPQTDLQTLCMALEALGNIGAADSSPKMVELIARADRKAECQEMVATDFTGAQTLICSRANLIGRIIHEIAHIGDHRAVSPLARLGDDESFDLSIRNLAKEFVYRMQYARPE